MGIARTHSKSAEKLPAARLAFLFEGIILEQLDKKLIPDVNISASVNVGFTGTELR